MEDKVAQVESAGSSVLPSFPIHRNSDYNGIQSRSGVNGNAVAAFVLGLGGIVPAAVVFGVRALGQINDIPQKGKTLAYMGLGLSLAWLVVLVIRLSG